VQYVQFVDGSTFGDETTAKDILGTRSAILDALRRLDKASNSETSWRCWHKRSNLKVRTLS
jgi:hypothetical protein